MKKLIDQLKKALEGYSIVNDVPSGGPDARTLTIEMDAQTADAIDAVNAGLAQVGMESDSVSLFFACGRNAVIVRGARAAATTPKPAAKPESKKED